MKPLYISLGAGVQSTALLCLAEKGFLKGVKGAIFADTGGEPEAVYEWLDFLKETIKKTPIHTVQSDKGNLHEYAVQGKHNPVPLFGYHKDTKKSFMGRRSCTFLFKILPVQKKIRDLEGIAKYQRQEKKAIQVALGISTDEEFRAKPSRTPWIENIHPLIKKGMSRQDCLNFVRKTLNRTPPRSACVFCPYLKDIEFKQVKSNSRDWERACTFDENSRHQTIDKVQYVHRQRKPLRDIDLKGNDSQITGFIASCDEAYCGV